MKVDLDLGNNERFLDIKLTCDNNITAGKIYQSVIDKERRGDYLGRTVQALLHASIACYKKLIVDWDSATDLEATTAKEKDALKLVTKSRKAVSCKACYKLIGWPFPP
ncbi:hypothetical protein AAC387_Pa12g0454 [Persea americana]